MFIGIIILLRLPKGGLFLLCWPRFMGRLKDYGKSGVL